mgnify:CR=1 FL=1
MESIADAFKKRGFIVNVVSDDGTVHTLGWDISGSLRGAYTQGKLVVKTIKSDNSEAMIDDEGKIIPYVDIKIKYMRETGSVDADGKPAEKYPANPNGSPDGITGVTTADGRFTIVMPHPERVFRSAQMSWAPDAAPDDSPWMRMFRNARAWVG